MDKKPKQNNMGQGGQKPGNFGQDRQQRDSKSGQRNEQAGFQHEPKPGADQQNKNPGGGERHGQTGGQGREAAQPRQGSRDENR